MRQGNNSSTNTHYELVVLTLSYTIVLPLIMHGSWCSAGTTQSSLEVTVVQEMDSVYHYSCEPKHGSRRSQRGANHCKCSTNLR